MSANLVRFENYSHVRLPTLYQEQTGLTKYSRWLDEQKRREFWPETVFRYWDFMANHVFLNFGYLIPEADQVEIFEAICVELGVMPSMRAMMTAGPALARDNAAAYNCSYAPVDRLETHDEAFYLTMCSCGVGFSVERQYTNQMPFLPDTLVPCDTVILVEDDKIGWSYSYRRLLQLLYDGFIPTWDVSRVRNKGSRLVTFGGRASGPEPLVDLFNHAITIFNEAIENGQRRLTSLQQHDLMTKASDVANSGGVRRGAEISLSNPSDERMRDAKSGEWWVRKPHFRLANNSNVWTDYPSSTQFMDEWIALVKSQAGERGQINRQALINQARRVRRVDVDIWGEHYGLNPCVSGETLIAVAGRGPVAISQLAQEEKDVPVFACNEKTGEIVVRLGHKPRLTGQNIPMVRVELDDGTFLRVTHDHKFPLRINGLRVCAKDLKAGDSLFRFDAINTKQDGVVIGPSVKERRLEYHLIAEAKYDRKFEWGRLDEQFNVHHVDDNHFNNDWDNIEVATVNAHSSYHRIGDRNPMRAGWWDGLTDEQKNAYRKNMSESISGAGNGMFGKKQTEETKKKIGDKARDRLASQEARDAHAAALKLGWRNKKNAIDEFQSLTNHKVVSVTPDGRADVYNMTVDGFHNYAVVTSEVQNKWGNTHRSGVFTCNCGEIILRPRQFCNLTTNIIRADDGLRALLRKIRLSTILGTLQSTLTDFRYLQPEWRSNCEEERLLGVSLNGIFDNRFMAGLDYVRHGTFTSDNFVVDGVKVELPNVLSQMRDVAVAINVEWADRIGINPSAAITTVKPEGNNSNLVDCRSGLHGAHAKHFYIRTNRANKVDRLAAYMITQGVYAEDDVSSPDTAWVMYFPMTVPDGAISREDYTALEHLKIWHLYQQYYCEHKPSVTISVKDREWMSVGAWVYENFDTVSGIAFLPYAGGNYRQAPFITCTRAQFDELAAKTPTTIDWSNFHEDSDYTEQAKELACMSGFCEI